MSLQKSKAVSTASKWKYIAAGHEVQVHWDGIHEWWKPEKEAWHVSTGKANAVLRELYHPAVTKWKLSNTAKLSSFKSIFVPILTYGHESWVMSKRVLSQVQVAEMEFLWRVHGLTLHKKVGSCEICKNPECKSHFSYE